MKKIVILFLVFSFFLVNFSFAEEGTEQNDVTVVMEKKDKDSSKSSGQSSFMMGGTMGAVVLTDENGKQKVYYQISLQPEFRFWRIGARLDLVVYFDEKNRLKEGDWNEDKLIEKVMYVEFNTDNEVIAKDAKFIDRIYLYLGGFPSYTFGHGLLMYRYTNMLSYPDVKKIGAKFKLDLGNLGFNVFTNNLEREEILGGRFFIRPFRIANMEIANLENLSTGISYITDTDPDDNSATKNDSVSGASFDISYPLINKSVFSLTPYYDIATLMLGDAYTVKSDSTGYNGYNIYANPRPKSGGIGMAYGILGNIIKILNYRAEYRNMDNNFIPGYFDFFYDESRKYSLDSSSNVINPSKAFLISNVSTPKLNGYFVNLGCDFVGKIKLNVSWEDVINTPTIGLYPWLHGELIIDKALLLNKYSLRFSYDKREADTIKKVGETDKNAVLKTELGYNIAENVAVFIIYKTTYDATGKSQTNTSMQMHMTF